MRTETDENYLKEIYTLGLDHPLISTSLLASRLGYSPASITGQLKKLANLHWVVYEPYQGVTLTETGRAIALEVIRHHRLIETYLVRALDIPWDRVHEEAEKLEHALSEYLEERIDEMLGHPSVDPHGSPIPSRDGIVFDSNRLRLADLPKGAVADILEVNDRDPNFLGHLDKINLRPGTQFEVLDVEPFDGLITIRVSNQVHTLGQTSASQIFVKKREEKSAGVQIS
ncbi:MAG TPA: metal-dependent transcriptional regulator [Anaerolineaceae bacterium]|nr:metal-dependent transcriptional regulator [Anaerolineaceae bacterium]